MMQLILFSRSVGAVRHVGSQITNVLSTDSSATASSKATRSVTTPRKTVHHENHIIPAQITLLKIRLPDHLT
jgi:hypothetical protein